MLKYVSTRWLSLQSSVERILTQYPALRSYFLSQDESESDRRLSRLQALFNDSMTEACLSSQRPISYCSEIARVFTSYVKQWKSSFEHFWDALLLSVPWTQLAL